MALDHYIIADFKQESLDFLKEYNVIFTISDIRLLESACSAIRSRQRQSALIVNTPYLSLSSITFNENMGDINITFNIFGIGEKGIVFNNVGLISRLQTRIYISTNNPEWSAELKILSSIGIDCGILFNGMIEDEKFLDLASYSLITQTRHAQIMPFDFIWQNLRAERNVDFDDVYFVNPERYIYLDNDYNIRFNPTDKVPVCTLSEFEKSSTKYVDSYRLSHYYSHFNDLTTCSKCESFKICNHKAYSVFSDCVSVYKEVYELAELRFRLENKAQKQCLH